MTFKHLAFTSARSALRGALALTAVAACSSDHAPPDVAEPAAPLAPASLDPAERSTERAADTPIYLNRRYSPEERAADLVSRMTLAEKASQMVSSQAAAIPSLGVPAGSLARAPFHVHWPSEGRLQPPSGRWAASNSLTTVARRGAGSRSGLT